ncbi:scribbler [Carabus blaptoides fortunei]
MQPQPTQIQQMQPQNQQIVHPQQIPASHHPSQQHPSLTHQNHAMPQHQQQQPQSLTSPVQQNKIPQFKVKPTAALMPDDKKDRNKPQNYKKKNRKSPAGSPHPHPQPEQPVFGIDQSGREEVQSPAYSDISDDAAPVLESEVGDKNKTAADKKTETGQTMPHSMPQYGMYPFYGQPPYLVPSVQQQVPDGKPKEVDKVTVDKSLEKDPKKDAPEYQQKMLQQHYYSYGYVPGYGYNMEPSYGAVSMVPEDKLKEERIKESPSPAEHNNKPAAPIPNPIQVPTPGKVKSEPAMKEKHQNENHQILKESIEMKNQMSPKEPQPPPEPQSQKNSTPNKPPSQSPSVKHKEKIVSDEKKEKEVKQEGVKPTMETQGPPPPPTSQYAYIHPSYMQSPHYGALPFDPNHPMYRSMLVPGPYSASPYLHPQIPRYHAPEDLSRPPQGPTKALDLLQHHANQYYTSHKIHELQERAMKSPTPKTSVASASPSSGGGPPSTQQPPGPGQQGGPPTSQAPGGGGAGGGVGGSQPPGGKQTPVDSKESRSPPPQRHVHTHHHTHVGLGYPLYAPPYGAAVLASQQAAAVTVINPYPPK